MALKRRKKGVLTELERLGEASEFERKTERMIEEKVYEIKAVAYLILVIAVILLCLALGYLLKSFGF